MELEQEIFKRYCPNCSEMTIGYRGNDGRIRMECRRCGLVCVVTLKNRRHSTTEEYLPKYAEKLKRTTEYI